MHRDPDNDAFKPSPVLSYGVQQTLFDGVLVGVGFSTNAIITIQLGARF